MSDNLAEASLLVSFVAAILGLLALLPSFSSHAHQWPAAYKRITGLIVAFLGLLTVGGSIAWLQSKHLSLTQWPGVGIVGAGVMGIGLCIAGTMRVVRAPLDEDAESLRAIADEMLSQLSQAKRSPFGGTEFVEVTATEMAGRGSGAPLVARLLRERNPVVVVSGPPGAGKSTALRELALRVCRRARGKRHPQLLALYIDLSTIDPGDGVPTSEMIRDHVRKVIARDSVMGAKLDACLRGDGDRAHWIFLLDSLDELAIAWPPEAITERMEQFFDAVERFLRPGGARFRAVVTIRGEPPPPPGYSVLTLEPLSRRQQRRFMRAAGLRPAAQNRVFRQMRAVADDVLGAPLPLRLWCENLVRTLSRGGEVAVPGTLYEVIEATVNARLRTVSDAGSRAESSAVAEQIAFCMATETGLGSAPSRSELIAALRRNGFDDPVAAEDAMHWLTELRLAAAGRPHTFAFAHRSFQDFFLTRWLLSGHDRPRPEVVLTDQQWREAAVIALQVGSDQLRERLLTTAAQIVDEETAHHPALVPDVAEYLALHPWAPLPVLPPIVGTATIWSGRLAHVLKLLAAGLATEPMLVPEPIRASSGRLVITAFLRGNRSDQKTALELLPLLHTALARWACEWAANVWSQLLVETAVRVSYRDPTLLPSMRIQSRALLVAGVARSPRLFGELLRARIPGRSDGTLPAIVNDLMLVLRLMAVFIAGLAAFYLTKDLANHLGMDTVLTWFAVAVVALAFFVLSFWLDPGRISGIQFVSGAVVVAGAVVMAVHGLSMAIASIIALFSDFQSGMLGLVLAFILTWPASLIGYLVVDPSARRRHWGCPQWFLGRVLVTELRASTPEFSWSSAVGRAFAVVTSLGFVLLLAVVLVLLLAPPPGEREPEGGQSRWAYAVLAILGAVAAVRAGLRKLSVRSRIRRSISSGVVTDDTLLTLLYGSDSQSDTKLLLTKLGQLPPAALHSCVAALTDLAQALEHVSRMVPVQKAAWGLSGGNVRIPRGVWDVGPQYSHSGFREWLEGYDAKHRGRLRWLASTHRDTIARLLEQAKATPVR